ncbi:hypothetical protein LIMNO130_30093 [Limnobacter sp. 130]|nr:hypothetical protein LIMNO130_30093 [Limnobacter sp. 130]
MHCLFAYIVYRNAIPPKLINPTEITYRRLNPKFIARSTNRMSGNQNKFQ